MIVREATENDIEQIFIVRNSVNENKLRDPSSIKVEDCLEYLTVRGKGWVCLIENEVAGFAIADVKGNNVWALFVKPEFEKQGIGKLLHGTMLEWYFSETQMTVWLTTGQGTRAESFYRQSGWKEVAENGKSEIRFEMTFENWKECRICL